MSIVPWQEIAIAIAYFRFSLQTTTNAPTRHLLSHPPQWGPAFRNCFSLSPQYLPPLPSHLAKFQVRGYTHLAMLFASLRSETVDSTNIHKESLDSAEPRTHGVHHPRHILEVRTRIRTGQ